MDDDGDSSVIGSDDDEADVKTYVTSSGGYGVEDPDEGVSRMPYPGEMGPGGTLVENPATGDQGVEDENLGESIPLPPESGA
jgi:hypothetical protein